MGSSSSESDIDRARVDACPSVDNISGRLGERIAGGSCRPEGGVDTSRLDELDRAERGARVGDCLTGELVGPRTPDWGLGLGTGAEASGALWGWERDGPGVGGRGGDLTGGAEGQGTLGLTGDGAKP